MTDARHVEEIGRVLDGAQTGRDALVSASWRRCVELYGMDPTRADPAHIVTETELRAHRQQAEWMIAAARSGLQALFRQVAGQNYVLLLTDAKGVCVDFFGDELFAEELRGAGLYLGSNWAEDLAGTCGVGACIVTQQPVTVHQDDHFGNAHTALSCTSAPIFDSLGRLAAVLDISLLRAPQPKSSQNLAMSLVTTAARRVEMANLMAESPRDWVLRLSASPEFLDVDPEAAVRLDGAGRIIGHTNAARALFPDGAPLIGRRIDEALTVGIDELPDLMRDRPTEERMIRTADGGALFAHAIAPNAPRAPLRGLRREGPLAALTGGDPAMERLLDQARRLAPGRMPLLISGETGTGKTRLARAIHMTGGAPGFAALDCAALDPCGIDAALEGAAGPTTLLLRRVEDLSPAVAAALAGALDRRAELRPVSTSCLAPGALAQALPAALFHRLAGARLALPPLRLRRDLGWLIDRLLRRCAAGEARLSPAARTDLLGRTWPGNIRELEQTLDVAAALAPGAVIDLPDLPRPVEEARPDPAAAAAGAEAEAALLDALEACEWNMARAARRLGVNRSTILRRVRKAGLQRPD